MSDSAFRDWMFTDSWSDYRQQREIRELGTELSSLNQSLYRQRSEATQLRSQISQLQGSLDERLTKLTNAFDAFVELSDIRETLALFDAPALVRHRTRQLLAGVGQPTDVPATLRLPPDQDYWLSPAARALGELLNGTDASADIAAAQALDAERTALLITATAALAGRTELAVEWLSQALGQLIPGVPLTAAKRLLWREAANGSFGPAGVAAIETRLRGCVVDVGDAVRAAVSVQAVPTSGIALLGKDESVVAALEASRQLTALRRLCEAPTTEVGPEALGDLVRQLVDEGTEEEKPLLRRVAELRAVIENRSVDEEAPRFDAPAGTPEDLVIADAADATNGAVGVLARRVLAEELLALAASLAGAAVVDPPTGTVASLRTGEVRITVDGPDAGDVKKAQAKAEAGYPPVVVLDPATWALIVGGLVLVVVSVFLPTVLTVLGVLVAAGLVIAGGTRLVSRYNRRTEQASLRERAGRDVSRRADQAWKELLASAGTVKKVGEGALEDQEAIRQALKV